MPTFDWTLSFDQLLFQVLKFHQSYPKHFYNTSLTPQFYVFLDVHVYHECFNQLLILLLFTR